MNASASTPLSAKARGKLAKLLALLGSDQPGERDAAGLAAHRLLQQFGTTWNDILAPAPTHREPLQSTWRATCATLLAQSEQLRPWERKFVADLPRFARISSKQRYCLGEIADRVLGKQNV